MFVWPIFELLGGIPQSEMTCSVHAVDPNCRELKLITVAPLGISVYGRRMHSIQIESTLSSVCRRTVSICYCGCEYTVISIRTAGNGLLTCRKCFFACDITPFSTSIWCVLLRRSQKIVTDWKWILAHVCFRSVLKYMDLLDGNIRILLSVTQNDCGR